MSHSGYVLAPGEGRDLDLGPFRMTVKAEAAQTHGAFSLLEATEPAGFGPPLHVHDDAAEAFYVLEGEYVVFIRGEEHRCPAGSFIYIPAGEEHGFRVGGGPSRKLNLYLPAAMIGYFDARATASAGGTTLDEDALAAIAAQHAMRVLGPVPEGYL
ncbi:MAG: cupin domain-containing protein [Mycobacteriales bacterium]